jgi:hypothetical protein
MKIQGGRRGKPDWLTVISMSILLEVTQCNNFVRALMNSKFLNCIAEEELYDLNKALNNSANMSVSQIS